MNLKTFFTYQNLFVVNTAYTTPPEKLFFLIGIILVLLSVVIKIASVLAPNPVDARLRHKFYVLFLSIGLAMMLWYFLLFESAMFFGSMFVALLIVVTGVIWLVAILVNLLRSYNKDKDVWQKQQVKLKYLPK